MAKETIELIITATDKASKGLGKIGSALGGLGKAAGVGAAAFGAAAAGIGAAALKLAADAAPLQGVQDAFAGISEAAGVASADMLRALEEGSAGMISQRDLMMSFNQAAQLVGEDFALKLPEAMQYLGKVSMATGEDMSFMMDSLVKGVGRLSPMILDNLGIQVNLTEANEAYAASIGKTVDELTKGEQQAALMNQVLAKLAENTANMPDMTTSAAASFAQLSVQLQNLKDQIGLALLPVITPLVEGFVALAQQYGPQVIEMFNQFAANLQQVAGPASLAFNDAFTRIGQALGLTTDEVTGMDLLMGALSGTLDAVVIGVQAAAVGMQALASAIEAVSAFVERGIAGLQRFADAAGQVGGALSGIAASGAPTAVPGGAMVPGFGYVPGFQHGGVVPGPRGRSRLAMVEGGETILPTHKGPATVTVPVYLDGQQIAQVIAPLLGRGTRQLAKMGGHGRL